MYPIGGIRGVLRQGSDFLDMVEARRVGLSRSQAFLEMAEMKELAERLAPAFDKAQWSDVEDGVSLTVWVKRMTGEELTLEQAAKLREAMEAEMQKFPKIVIYVSGGVVQGCTSNMPNLKVVLIDRDNLDEEADPEEAAQDALVGSEDCTHDVY